MCVWVYLCACVCVRVRRQMPSRRGVRVRRQMPSRRARLGTTLRLMLRVSARFPVRYQT